MEGGARGDRRGEEMLTSKNEGIEKIFLLILNIFEGSSVYMDLVNMLFSSPSKINEILKQKNLNNNYELLLTETLSLSLR